ncbi:MAG: S41 family peptidase [Gemmatimonadota bacterium]
MNESSLRPVRRYAPRVRSRTRILLGLCLAVPTISIAPPTGGASVRAQLARPSCQQTLDSIDAKLRDNYAGFLLEVRAARRSAYDAMRAEQRRAGAEVSLDDCFPILSRYIDWFDDPHLFVYQSPTPDSASANKRRGALRTLDVSDSAIRRDLSNRRDARDPIEGIWYDGATRIGVVRDAASTERYVAVLLASDTLGWPAGAVRATFERRPDGGYATTLTTRAFGELRLVARIHRRVVLRLSPGMWGKAFPVAAEDTAFVDPTDVHRPSVAVRPRSVVVSVPSHDPRFTSRLDRLVTEVDSVIRDRRLLIIDLRGNEGRGSQTTRVLDPYISTAVSGPTPYDSGVPVMLSSRAQVAYARRFTGTDTSVLVRSLVARLEASPGALVPLEETPSARSHDRSLDGDWQVVVMVDRGTVSASEVLVLRALRSTRAVVVGENTAGALDYQSVQIVGLGTGDRRWALGYPTITAHADLPKRGMRGTWIAPTVRVDWHTLDDPIAEMERRYAPPAR